MRNNSGKNQGIFKKISAFFEREETYLKRISKNIVYTIIGTSIFFIFLYSPVNVLSAAMEPALLEGDYILVSKFSYGYGENSFPIKLPFKGRIFQKLPERGDVIAFRTPNNQFGIQRVIGLPGDRVQIKNSILYINNKAVPRKFLGKHEHVCKFHEKLGVHGATVDRFLETLPEGKQFETLDTTTDNIADDTYVHTIPRGYCFVLGDNRDEAIDSRYANISFISFDHIIGEVKIVLFSLNDHSIEFWKWPSNIRWKRFFKMIK